MFAQHMVLPLLDSPKQLLQLILNLGNVILIEDMVIQLIYMLLANSLVIEYPDTTGWENMANQYFWFHLEC